VSLRPHMMTLHLLLGVNEGGRSALLREFLVCGVPLINNAVIYGALTM
jgi:hypothetical protein